MRRRRRSPTVSSGSWTAWGTSGPRLPTFPLTGCRARDPASGPAVSGTLRGRGVTPRRTPGTGPALTGVVVTEDRCQPWTRSPAEPSRGGRGSRPRVPGAPGRPTGVPSLGRRPDCLPGTPTPRGPGHGRSPIGSGPAKRATADETRGSLFCRGDLYRGSRRGRRGIHRPPTRVSLYGFDGRRGRNHLTRENPPARPGSWRPTGSLRYRP